MTMRKQGLWGMSCCLIALATAPALAQYQPWTPRSGSVESRIGDCASHTPLNKVALDDFTFTAASTRINSISWWGRVSGAAQLGKKFYIAIYNSGAGACAGTCNPAGLIASWCTVPTSTRRMLMTDCNGNTIYRFNFTLPAPGLTLGAGTYFLQVSESDFDSVTVGAEDFRWSGHSGVTGCSAQQRDAAWAATCSIHDDCPNSDNNTDLAYVLGTTVINGALPPGPVFQAPAVFLAQIRPGTNPQTPPVAEAVVEPEDNGTYFIDDLVPLPNGQYTMTLIGMGINRPKQTFTMQDGVGTCSFFDVFVGDLNNDGRTDSQDIQPLINGVMHP